MGYTTKFKGEFTLNKVMDEDLATYINKFSTVRHMKRDKKKIRELYPTWKRVSYKKKLGRDAEFFLGVEDYIDGDESVIDKNNPPCTQPGLYCSWRVSEDRTAIIWDGSEKFYHYTVWLRYLVKRFLRPNGYTINGRVEYQGERDDDSGYIEAVDNIVKKHKIAVEVKGSTASEEDAVPFC